MQRGEQRKKWRKNDGDSIISTIRDYYNYDYTAWAIGWAASNRFLN